MNPGIFYLYEYNNTQKLRNAGFLKITQYYHTCTLQLNARGIPVSYANSIKLYAFFMENNQITAAGLAEIACANHALSARMTSAESQFPHERPLKKIDGFFLPLPNGHILAAAAPGIVIDTQKLLSASMNPPLIEDAPVSDTASSEENAPASDTASSEENAPVSDTVSSEENVPVSDTVSSEENVPVSDSLSSTENASISDSLSSTENSSGDITEKPNVPETSAGHERDETADETTGNMIDETLQLEAESVHECVTENAAAEKKEQEEAAPETEQNDAIETDPTTEQNTSSAQDSPQQNIRKIQRSELSILPRKYWHLANNSFLLHGYHNYNHLILIQKDGHYWLGVPGIYDPHEARAARLFGFPQFTDSYNKFLDLSDDECNPQENFGYWCCYLK